MAGGRRMTPGWRSLSPGARRGKRSRMPLLGLLLSAIGTVFIVMTAHKLLTKSFRVHRVLPKAFEESPLYVFVHIPKAGGTSFKRVLEDHARLRGFLIANHLDNFLSFPPAKQNTYSVIMGHMGYGIHHQRNFNVDATRPVKYLTFLREPTARTWSSYFFSLRADRLYNELGHAKPPFDEWFLKMRPQHDPWSVQNNPNTQQLCCFNYYAHVEDWETEGVLDDAYALCRTPSEATLKCAMDNLRTFEFIGIVEKCVQLIKIACTGRPKSLM